MNAIDKPQTVAAPDLATLVANVLGELAFLFADPDPAQVPPGADGLAAESEYVGPCSGRLRCWCTRGLAQRLAASLLAIEPHEHPAESGAEDALREFMNVLCGQLVAAWHDPRGVYELSLPRAQAHTAPSAASNAEAPHVCRLSVDGEFLVCAYERVH